MSENIFIIRKEWPDINKRMAKIIMQECGGNQTAFAKAIGVLPQSVNRLFNQDKRSKEKDKEKEPTFSTVSEDMFVGIVRVYKHINIYWLLTGNGEMKLATQQENTQLPPGVQAIIDVLEKQNEILEKGFNLNAESNKTQAVQPLQKAVSVVLDPGLNVDIQMNVIPKKDDRKDNDH